MRTGAIKTVKCAAERQKSARSVLWIPHKAATKGVKARFKTSTSLNNDNIALQG